MSFAHRVSPGADVVARTRLSGASDVMRFHISTAVRSK